MKKVYDGPRSNTLHVPRGIHASSFELKTIKHVGGIPGCTGLATLKLKRMPDKRSRHCISPERMVFHHLLSTSPNEEQ